MKKCEIVVESRPISPTTAFSGGYPVVVCRTHNVAIEGYGPVECCIVGRLERLEANVDQLMRTR